MTKIIALTEPGHRLAERIRAECSECCMGDVEILYKPAPFAETVQQLFKSGSPLIFISATGIVMRTLAPVLTDKYKDPPVLVLDELGQYVIPLLSGHQGGANDWALRLAESLSAQSVITTANAYCRPIYTVGLGCERNCPKEALLQLMIESLQRVDLCIDNVRSVHSIDIKADEIGILELSSELDKPYYTWTAQQLRTVEGQLSSRSEYVFNTVGVYGVCESAALVGAMQHTGESAELVVTKHKSRRATCAVARSYPKAAVSLGA